MKSGWSDAARDVPPDPSAAHEIDAAIDMSSCLPDIRSVAEEMEVVGEQFETLMAEYDEALARANFDHEAPNVVALEQQIQEVRETFADLADQFCAHPAAYLPMPGMGQGPHL